jgi:hypothetical protein
MSRLEELKEAVELYQAVGFRTLGDDLDSLCTIADCLTSREPITKEALEALGFENRSPLSKEKWRVVSTGGEVVEAWEHNGGYSFIYAPTEGQLWRSLLVQPETVGDLWCLLLRLSREQP